MRPECHAMAEIVRTENTLGGDPRIAGTRVGVLHIHALVVEGDHDPADIADQLDLPLEAVYSALAYYYAHPEEMQAVRQSHDAAADDLRNRSLKPPKTAE